MFPVLLGAGLLWFLTGCVFRQAARPEPAPEIPSEIAESISPFKTFDHRPYELIWAQRKEEEPPLVDFEGLLGWTMQTEGDVRASFDRTQELQLWREYVGKLTWSGGGPASRITLRPPEPIPLRDRFDSINFWIFGDHDPRGSPLAAPVRVQVLIETANGETVPIEVAEIRWRGWALAHRRLDAGLQGKLSHPCRLAGVVFDGGAREEKTTMYMDSLCLFTERLPPLAFEPRPSRNLPLLPGQAAGLQSGETRLPFPVTEDTILPPLHAAAWSNRVESVSETVVEFVYQGEDGRLVYALNATQGLAEVEAFWNGKRIGRGVAGAAVSGTDGHYGAPVVFRQEGGGVRVEYANGVIVDLTIRQKTLIADVVCRGGAATGLVLGRMEDVQRPRSLTMPFLAMPPDAPPGVALLEWADGAAIFGSVWLDWYRSNASELFTRREAGADFVAINGGARYLPSTEGRRNDLFERVLLTFSPRLEEVLPSLPNPKGTYAEIAMQRLWVDSTGPQDFKAEHDAGAALRRHGLSELIQGTGVQVWQDEYESYSLRTRAAPFRGGDEELLKFVGDQKALGWHTGLYANYIDLSPLSQHWSGDAVARAPDGGWRSIRPGQYVLKPPRAVEWQGLLSARVRDRFHAEASYLDAVSALPPWTFTDYDARVPGAARMTDVFYCHGELLRNESLIFKGPVVTAGGCPWLYAGLADAHLGTGEGAMVRAGDPFLPLYVLTRIHPLECGYGLGPLASFFEGDSFWRDDPGAAVDTYLAAEIGYGRAGRLVDAELGMALICRSYYMMQQLQIRYGLKAPTQVAYWDGERLLSTSDAVRLGVHERSQMYFSYPGDLEVWVNGSKTGAWQVKVGRDTWRLPPQGWVAAGPDFLELSAEVDGARLDYVASPAYVYYDGRGRSEPFRDMACRGPVVLQRDPGRGGVVLYDPGATGRFGWREPDASRVPDICRGYDVNGVELAPVLVEQADGMCWITGPAGGLRYEFEYEPAGGTARLTGGSPSP